MLEQAGGHASVALMAGVKGQGVSRETLSLCCCLGIAGRLSDFFPPDDERYWTAWPPRMAHVSRETTGEQRQVPAYSNSVWRWSRCQFALATPH